MKQNTWCVPRTALPEKLALSYALMHHDIKPCKNCSFSKAPCPCSEAPCLFVNTISRLRQICICRSAGKTPCFLDGVGCHVVSPIWCSIELATAFRCAGDFSKLLEQTPEHRHVIWFVNDLYLVDQVSATFLALVHVGDEYQVFAKSVCSSGRCS